MNDNITVWCVKYAITEGIIPFEGHYLESGNFYGKRSDSERSYPMVLGKNDFRETLEQAKQAAEEVRARKIASLEKQLAKVRSMSIKVKTP